jgi:hypothetical protein
MSEGRAVRYARRDRVKRADRSDRALILAHVTRTPKGKIRLRRVGISLVGGGKKKKTREAIVASIPHASFSSNLFGASITSGGDDDHSSKGGSQNITLREDDPRLVFDNDFGVRKAAHEMVKRSARYSRFYNSIVKILYDEPHEEKLSYA